VIHTRGPSEARPPSHRPLEFHMDLHWGELGVGPLHDEVCQCLRVGGLTGRVRVGFSHELDQPFGDSPSCLLVLDDVVDVWELYVLLGGAASVLLERFSGFLLTLAEVP